MSTPSKESGALADLMKTFGSCYSQDGNVEQDRFIYEGVHRVATEASGVTYESTVVAGRPGLWIKPSGASSQHVILFMHGGGYSIGSPTGHRKLAAHLAKACNCVSLSIDYRLAPEHRFPAAVDDCLNAYEYLLNQGFRAEDIVTAGDSCGGALCTIVPLAAARKGLPYPGAVVSLSPWMDLTGRSPSRKTNQKTDVLNTPEFVAALADRYIGGTGVSAEDPLVSPIFAELKGLPPHWVSVAGHDMLRDDGERFAEKAREAGIEVVLDVGEGQQHVYEFMAGTAPEADRSLQKIGEWVKQKIGSHKSS